MLLFLWWLGACGGSFLNVLAVRLLRDIPITKSRSACLSCEQTIPWYDLIPVFSWFILRGKCRQCGAFFSYLYPLIEALAGFLAVFLHISFPPLQVLTYSILCSALLITIHTDILEFTIIRYFSLGLIPLALLASALNLLDISLYESALGIVEGYLFLWIPALIFKFWRKKEGMGEGDFELMAGIGAFLGPLGVWFTLLIGSVIGSLLSIILAFKNKNFISQKIPFGPFLALGAFSYLFFKKLIFLKFLP